MRPTLWLVSGLCVIAAACGGGDKGKVTKVRDAMCACKDKACVDKVTADSKELTESLQKKYKDEKDVPADLMPLLDEIDKCEDKAKTAEVAGKVKALADASCACKDKACADKVVSDMSAMSSPEMGKPTDEMMKDMQRAGECLAKVMTAEAAVAPPADPAPTAPPPADPAAPAPADPAAPAPADPAAPAPADPAAPAPAAPTGH